MQEIEEALRILEEFSESTKQYSRTQESESATQFGDMDENEKGKEEELRQPQTEGEKRRKRNRDSFHRVNDERSSMVSLPAEGFPIEIETLASRSSLMDCILVETHEQYDPLEGQHIAVDFDNQFKPKDTFDDFVFSTEILDLSRNHAPANEPCTICFERSADYQLSCTDQYCSLCLREHFMTKILEGQALHITCPACTSQVSDMDIKSNLSPQMLEKYLHFKKMAALRADPNCRWCPKPNCDTSVIANLDHPEFPALECSKCSTKFCYQCNQSWHPKVSCKKNAIQLRKKGLINSRDEKWKKKNSKKCPKCRVDIEKESGCNHIICTSCSHQFCWLCMGEYTPEHYSTGSCANKCFEAEEEFDLFTNFGKPRTSLQKIARVGKYSVYTIGIILSVGVGVPVALGVLPIYGLGWLAVKAVKR